MSDAAGAAGAVVAAVVETAAVAAASEAAHAAQEAETAAIVTAQVAQGVIVVAEQQAAVAATEAAAVIRSAEEWQRYCDVELSAQRAEVSRLTGELQGMRDQLASIQAQLTPPVIVTEAPLPDQPQPEVSEVAPENVGDVVALPAPATRKAYMRRI